MIAETDVAAVVVAYLRDLGWDVHQEVGGAYGPRADIVAVRGPLLYVVEVKTTLGLALIEQGQSWLHRAHLVSIAAPHPHRGRGPSVAHQICGEWGIGVLDVLTDYGESAVRERVAPRLIRRIPVDRSRTLRRLLTEETRTYASAGNAAGKFWSPFKDTCQQAVRAVAAHPGLTTKELVAALPKHHYSSDSVARNTLPRWLRLGKIPGLRGEGERPIRWYLAGATLAASPSSS